MLFVQALLVQLFHRYWICDQLFVPQKKQSALVIECVTRIEIASREQDQVA